MRLRTPLAALALLLASLVLAACGDDEASTTTVTSPSTPPAALTSSTVPGAASSDAAAAVPEGTTAVEGATTEATTATTPAPAAVVGEVPNGAAVQIDPATGQPLAPATTPTTSSAAAPAASTALPPATSAIPAQTAPTSASSTSSASTSGILQRPFSATSPWNTQVVGQPVDPDSRGLIKRAQLRTVQVEQPNGDFRRQERRITVGLTVNVTRWTVPVFSDNQPGAVERIAVCRQFDCGPDAITSLTVPPDACPDPQYDGWMTALDTSAGIAYDLWRARCEMDGSLSYHYVKTWELDGPGFQQPGGVSARGSGLPLFAGLITPEEIESGRIDHALAISVPGAAKRRYVQPASRTDGVGSLDSLPEGARIRLRSGAEKRLTKTFVRNGTQRAAAGTIIDALERYGAIVVDRSAAPTMYAQRNFDWTGLLPLNLLQDIPLSRFEVVALDEILFDPPKAGEEQVGLPLGTPSSIPGSASGTQAPSGYGTPDTDFGQVLTP